MERVTGLGYDTHEIEESIAAGVQSSGVVAYTVSERQLLTERLGICLLAPTAANEIALHKSRTMPTQKPVEGRPARLKHYPSSVTGLAVHGPAPVNPVLKQMPNTRIRVRSLGCDEKSAHLRLSAATIAWRDLYRTSQNCECIWRCKSP